MLNGVTVELLPQMFIVTFSIFVNGITMDAKIGI